jgi:hypothetical protein
MLLQAGMRSIKSAPDFVDLVVIPAGFNEKAVFGIGLDLPKPAHHFIQVIRDNYDLPIGDTDELVGVPPAHRLYCDHCPRKPEQLKQIQQEANGKLLANMW